MIDLTPLDVRKKKGDFRRALRGYDTLTVDEFLDLVAERLEQLVRENAQLKERVSGLTESLTGFRERERAMNDALITAQQLREDMRQQATRDAELTLQEARLAGEQILAEARQEAQMVVEATGRIQHQRAQFLRSFRAFVEQHIDEIEQEEERLRAAERASRPAELQPEPLAAKDLSEAEAVAALWEDEPAAVDGGSE